MLATINTPKVQVPFDVSLLHPVLIIQGYNQNYMKYIYNFYLIPFGNIYLFCIYYMITLEYNNWVNFFCSIFTNATFQIVRYRRVMLSIFRCLNIGLLCSIVSMHLSQTIVIILSNEIILYYFLISLY